MFRKLHDDAIVIEAELWNNGAPATFFFIKFYEATSFKRLTIFLNRLCAGNYDHEHHGTNTHAAPAPELS